MLGDFVYERWLFDLETLEFDPDARIMAIPLGVRGATDQTDVRPMGKLVVTDAEAVEVHDEADIGIYDIFPIDITSMSVSIRSNFGLSVVVFTGGDGAIILEGLVGKDAEAFREMVPSRSSSTTEWQPVIFVEANALPWLLEGYSLEVVSHPSEAFRAIVRHRTSDTMIAVLQADAPVAIRPAERVSEGDRLRLESALASGEGIHLDLRGVRGLLSLDIPSHGGVELRSERKHGPGSGSTDG